MKCARSATSDPTVSTIFLRNNLTINLLRVERDGVIHKPLGRIPNAVFAFQISKLGAFHKCLSMVSLLNDTSKQNRNYFTKEFRNYFTEEFKHLPE